MIERLLAKSDGSPQARLGVYRRVRDQLVETAEKSDRRISERAAAELVSELDAAIEMLEARFRTSQAVSAVRPAPAARVQPAAVQANPPRARPVTTPVLPDTAKVRPLSAPARPVSPPPASPPAIRPAVAAVAAPPPAAPGARRVEALLKAALDDELLKLGALPIPADTRTGPSGMPERGTVLPLPRAAAQLRRDIGPLAIAALVLTAVLLAAAVIVAAA